MKLSEFKKLVREEIRNVLAERTQDEIEADKESIAAQVIGAKAKLKAAQAGVKVAKAKIGMLNKKKSEIQGEKPTEDIEEEKQ